MFPKPMTLVAGAQIGKYVVRRKLAEGGMAEIYLCTARGVEGFEKEVVIKRVRAFLASDPEFVEMFIAEARLASRLNHENVVQIFDFDKHENTYYLAMEYVRGCSLWELRRKSKELMDPVPPVLVAHLGAEVARGLHYAHRLKVNGQPLDLVHRDVTPHNVLLSYDGAVKLTDFGIAKAGKKLTQPGVLKGKFAYMAPEQARGEAVDARTDLFALGVVLWEMVTGGRLFDGDSEVAVLRAVQFSVIPPPARLNPEVPPELDAVVMRALERDPAARFQTAGELERALAQCVLKHAKSVDDTDLGAFMRRLFPGSLTQAMPAVQERTHVVDGAPVPDDDDEEDLVPPPRRDPTAVMRAGRAGMAPPSSPDEDVDASTFVLPRRGEDVEALSVPLPPMATPMMPLPAVASSPVPRANAPLPPLAAPMASVRPSRPEGTPAVASPEERPRSDITPAAPTKTPSRSSGLAPVSREGAAGASPREAESERSSMPGGDAARNVIEAEERAAGLARSSTSEADASHGASEVEGRAAGLSRSSSHGEEPGQGADEPSQRGAVVGSSAHSEGTSPDVEAVDGARSMRLTAASEAPASTRGSEDRDAGMASNVRDASARPHVPGAREGGPQSLSGSEVPTVTESSPGQPKRSGWLRPRRMVGATMALGFLLIVGAGVMNGLRSDQSAETPSPTHAPPTVASTPTDAPATARPSAPAAGSVGSVVKETKDTAPAQPEPRPVSPGSTPSAANPEPEPSDSDAEVDGLKREAVLGTAPKSVDAPSDLAPRAAAATGLLQLRATPYATVFLDGRRLGEVSGRASYKLAPGTYKLLFQHPSGEKRYDVTITAGATVTREFRPPRGR
nr:serine/threonine-protein kinase [Myxococcus eversor]